MPRLERPYRWVGKETYITTLNFTKGYWEVPDAAEDRTKTAFTTPYGLYQFTQMPFWIQGAPATFQRMVDRLLDGLGDFASVYIDDVIISIYSWNDHLHHINSVLEWIHKAMAECGYLGHTLGTGRVRPDKLKVRAIEQFYTPRTKKQVRSFLGMAGYYHKFLPQFASVVAPLTDLTRKVTLNEVE